MVAVKTVQHSSSHADVPARAECIAAKRNRGWHRAAYGSRRQLRCAALGSDPNRRFWACEPNR